MTGRELFFKAIRREMEGYVPFEFSLTPLKLEEFKQRAGTDDFEEYYRMPVRILNGYPADRTNVFKHLYEGVEDIDFIDSFGTGWQKGSTMHFHKLLFPMEHFETLKEFENYPYPDPHNDWDWVKMRQDVLKCKEKDLIAAGSAPTWIFEEAWMMRGMETFMVDMLVNPELVEYHMDRLTCLMAEIVKKQVEIGCDVILLGDDVSNQRDMMISVELWRKFHKPRLAKLIDTAKSIKRDIPIYFHSDGNPEKIIPELIEIGVDILNPVQPECIDPVRMKKLYGDRLSFWGTLGTQSTMPFGNPGEVRRVCREMIEKVGKGGGLVLAPTHILEPEVPWDNIKAFVETVNEHNSKINK